MPGKCKFQELWLQNEHFKDWMFKADDIKAKCKVCKTTIELSNMGEGAACFSIHYRSWKFSFLVSESQGKVREFDIWLRVGTLFIT